MTFENLPIQRKLMTIILGTSGVVLLIVCSTFLSYEFFTFRQSSVLQLSTLGEIIATNSTAALAFDNREDATEVLAALSAERHIEAACIYDKDGAVFARYPAGAPDAAFPAQPGADGYRFEGGHLIGFGPVAQVKGQRLGTLYLNSDMVALYDRLRLYAGIAVLVIAASSLVAYVLSRKLQQQISRPILALAEAARAVSERRDYSVRAPRFGQDELGLFTAAFNEMLAQIEEQNRALQRAYDDLRQTQQGVLQQERLRAVGQMASGIAHDINNAISPASLYIESLLEREANLSARARAHLTTIQRAIDDVAQTVSRLREFYRQREPQLHLSPVNLNQLVEQVAELTRAHWVDMAQQQGVSVELRMDLAPALGAVMGVESEIREALTNIIFNAVDAMPKGGTITIRTSGPRTVEPGGRPPPASPASNASAYPFPPPASPSSCGRSLLYAAVEIEDTGVGMDEETKRRCFEPFFTTKGERGTGLGLAMVYGAMRRHDAIMDVESAPGKGTVMRLLFPMPEAALPMPLAADGRALPPAPTRRLRVLVVDDDLVLLGSLRETLEADGHDIVTAPGGREGVDTFAASRTNGRPFDVVITDLGMPNVDGRTVARAIKTASPQTPVFLLTGWGQGMADEGKTPAHVDRVLTKPPKLRDLRAALASVALS